MYLYRDPYLFLVLTWLIDPVTTIQLSQEELCT